MVATTSFVTAADSARAVASVYTVSLLALVPIVLAGAAALLLRRTSAEGRVLAWRSSVAVLLLVCVGTFIPAHKTAWIMTSVFATPLVALGRVEMTSGAAHPQSWAASALLVRLVLAAYVAGVAWVLLPTIAALVRMHVLASDTRSVERTWVALLEEVRSTLGVRRTVRLVVSPHVAVPMTFGVLRPVVAMPIHARDWTASQRRMALMHELSHVRTRDWLFNVAARVACALYWFNPGVWWIARRLREDAELACDGRVVFAGAKRSEYAELLIAAADAVCRTERSAFGLALARRDGLRARLIDVLNVDRVARPIARRWSTLATVCTLLLAGSMSTVRLAPTRDVLTSLMRDARWESRAYAVLGLAQRADSLAVARSVALDDPSPRVRAWALYALDPTHHAAPSNHDN